MKTIEFESATLTPSKIVCIGRNYVAHINELNNEVPSQPLIFLKPNSAISDTLYTSREETIHYEGEIAFVIQDNRLSGVGFGLDLTKRDLQSKLKSAGHPWERCKAFDGSALFSHFVHIPGDLSDLRMSLSINGTIVQQGGYDLMIFKPDYLLTEISRFLTLNDGDIVMTGTPKGVGPLISGDVLTGSIYSSNKLLLEYSWTVNPPR